jgi:hypothetical protein
MASAATQDSNGQPLQQDRRAEVWAGTSGWKRFVAAAGRALERLYRRRMGWLFGHQPDPGGQFRVSGWVVRWLDG